MSFKKSMPSVNALVTFEAAARLKSFTAAARELNVSQAAVSRQIRLLEDDFASRCSNGGIGASSRHRPAACSGRR